MKQPIIITGIPRSGLRLVAMLLNSKDLWGGSDLNPGTYRSSLSKVLRDNRKDDFSIDVERLLVEQGWRGQDWFLNDWDFLHDWEFWDNQFPSAEWLIVRRDDESIIRSCMKTGWMNQHQSRAGWCSWLADWKSRIDAIKKSNARIHEVWPTKFVNEDYTEIVQALTNIGVYDA